MPWQGKMLQLRLPMEVQSGQSQAQRSAAAKRLVISMPVLHAQRQRADVTCLRQADSRLSAWKGLTTPAAAQHPISACWRHGCPARTVQAHCCQQGHQATLPTRRSAEYRDSAGLAGNGADHACSPRRTAQAHARSSDSRPASACRRLTARSRPRCDPAAARPCYSTADAPPVFTRLRQSASTAPSAGA